MGKTVMGTQSSIQKQSSLANTQEKILKEQYKVYQDYYLPEFKDFYSSLSPDSESGKAQMGLTAKEINTSFDAAQKQTGQIIAQKNLDGSGVDMALTAANNRARSSALAKAYANQQAATTENKGNALAQFSQLMPQPTTAAPIETKSSQTTYGSWINKVF